MKNENESNEEKAAKINAKGVVVTAIIASATGILGTLLGILFESKEAQIVLNQTFYGVISEDDEDITLEEIKQGYTQLQLEYNKIQQTNQNLSEENENEADKLIEANKQIGEMQKRIEESENEINRLNSIISGMYNVDFQNKNLIINGIKSDYIDRTATINEETFYSLGFFKYIIDNQAISSDNAQIFVGRVQTENQMPISLFDIEPFTKKTRFSNVTNMEDNYGNVYEEVLRIKTVTSNDPLDYAQEYFIENKYSVFSFDIFYAKDAAQTTDYEIIIYGDDKLLRSYIMDRKSKIEHINVDIGGVEFLQIVGRSISNNTDYYFGIINPYLYP